MELVASVRQSTDLVSQIAILCDLSIRLFSYRGAVLAETKADVILQMSCELNLRDLFLLKEVRLLLHHSKYHGTSVGVSVEHAHFVHLSGILVLLVLVH